MLKRGYSLITQKYIVEGLSVDTSYNPMEKIEVVQNGSVLISNLELLSYKADRLLEESNSTIFYSDYYAFYKSYTHYLASLEWRDEHIKILIDSLPSLFNPVFITNPLVVLIPILLVVVYPVNLIYLPVYYMLMAGGYGWVKHGNKKRLREISHISNQLINRLKS